MTPEFLLKLSNTFFQELEPTELLENTVDSVLESKEKGTCELCCSNVDNAVFMECRHGGACVDCAIKIWEQSGNCYLCREPITQVLEIAEEDSNVFRVVASTKLVVEESELN